MTYGWAILIIAVVLGALFQLGIFNASTFTPKAPPGACHIFRPNGPGTTSFINTQGICNGELPQYVAKFNGVSSDITIPATSMLKTINTTVVAWIMPSVIPQEGGIASFSTCATGGYFFTLGTGGHSANLVNVPFGGNNNVNDYTSGPISQDSWQQVAFTAAKTGASSSSINLYINGKLISPYSIIYAIAASQQSTYYIGYLAGACGWTNGYYQGMLSNIQVYNTSLSSNEIAALYNEGLGAAPIKLNNLVAWWPLNGDAKDYSGNNNNGVPSGVSFTSSWVSGYSAP